MLHHHDSKPVDILPLKVIHQQAQIAVQRWIIYMMLTVIFCMCVGIVVGYFRPRDYAELDEAAIYNCLEQSNTAKTMPAWTTDGCLKIPKGQ